jgi:hypothetical protein
VAEKTIELKKGLKALVILSEAKDLLSWHRKESRSLLSLRMTTELRMAKR